MTRYLSAAEIVHIHHQVMLDHRQAAVVLDDEKIEAAAARPASSAFGEDAYPSIAEKSAALLQSIVIGHPFGDGNKRAGLASALVLLRVNGVTAGADQDALCDLTMDVATGRERELDRIAARIGELFGLVAG